METDGRHDIVLDQWTDPVFHSRAVLDISDAIGTVTMGKIVQWTRPGG